MKRLTELDSLRGIAAIAVIFYHYTSRFSDKFDVNIITDHFRFDYGKYGVDLFFTISGFVIFMSIDKIKTPLEFIYKRLIRLYPTFWVCMITTFITTSILGPDVLRVNFEDFIKNTTMLPGLLNGKSIDGAYWTLKIEIFFYNVILLLMILKWQNKIKELGFAYLFLGFIILLIKYLNPISPILLILNYYIWGLLFLLGINFYQIKIKKGGISNHSQIIFSYSFTLLFSLETSIIVGIIIIIFYLFIYNKLTFLSFSPLLFSGRISYALYLTHQNIGHSIMLKMIASGVNNYIIILLTPIIFCTFLATVITYWIEKPIVMKLSHLYKIKFERYSIVS